MLESVLKSLLSVVFNACHKLVLVTSPAANLFPSLFYFIFWEPPEAIRRQVQEARERPPTGGRNVLDLKPVAEETALFTVDPVPAATPPPKFKAPTASPGK